MKEPVRQIRREPGANTEARLVEAVIDVTTLFVCVIAIPIGMAAIRALPVAVV